MTGSFLRSLAAGAVASLAVVAPLPVLSCASQPDGDTLAPSQDDPVLRTPPDAAPPRTVRVALCQIAAAGSRDEGLAAISAALEEASAQGADLACFPETCLFGWVNRRAHDEADTVPGETLTRLSALARHFDLMLAVGLAEHAEVGDALFDAAVLIDRDGRLLATHHKVNTLPELMDPPYTPGDGPTVVDTRLGRIGLLICADTFREDLVDTLGAEEPDLVLVPYGWAAPAADWPGHSDSLHAWIANTARRTGAPVVGVDGVGTLFDGPWKGYVLGGQSAVCDPGGSVRSTLADRAPEVRVVEVALARAPRSDG